MGADTGRETVVTRQREEQEAAKPRRALRWAQQAGLQGADKSSAKRGPVAQREPFGGYVREAFNRGPIPQHRGPVLRDSTKEKAMGNPLGKNVMQARINALTMKSADGRMLKTAKHIKENGLQENRSMRRHAKKEQQRLARLK